MMPTAKRSDRVLTPVFDEPLTNNEKPQGRSEPAATWLARSTRDIARESRALLDDWVTKLDGNADLVDLVARLRSGDDGQFRAAFFELYLHLSFLRSGWSVEVHAEQANGRRPDFVVTTPTGRAVVEATTTNPSGITSDRRRGVRVERPAYAPLETGLNVSQQKRLGVLLDRIDELVSPNFTLSVTHFEVGPGELSARKIKTDLTKWLATFDPDEDDPDDVFLVAEDGWRLEFEAYAKSPEYRGKPGRTIGISGAGEADEVTDDEALWRSLVAKANAYGDVGLPYVIAVNENSWERQDEATWHRTSALFGSSGIVAEGPMAGTPARQSDGFWRGTGWRNQDVSAVLLATNLSPWNVSNTDLELWLNPRPSRPTSLRLPLWRVRRAAETGGVGRLVVDEPAMTPEQFWR